MGADVAGFRGSSEGFLATKFHCRISRLYSGAGVFYPDQFAVNTY